MDTLRVNPQVELASVACIDACDLQPWGDVGRRPFQFKHNLAGHPLFELTRLAELSKLAAARENRTRFFRRSSKDASRTTADNIIALENRNDWIKISFANVLDPEYGRLHDTLLDEIERLSRVPIRETRNWSGLTIFMNSPGLAVPYHFDHETNFLMQVRGVKDVFLYDQTDRSVLTEREIERFYCGNAMAGIYRSDLDTRASHFVLDPGVAVHHPPLAPHRILNRDAVSVSVSLFFTLPEADRRAHVYQVNALMRGLRLPATPPGRSKRSDRLKVAFMRAVSKREPRTQSQMLFSGIRRLTLPARAVRKVISIARR